MINCHNSITAFTAHRRSGIINLAPRKCHPSFAPSLTTLRVHCMSGGAALFVMNSPPWLTAAQYKTDVSKRRGLALDCQRTMHSYSVTWGEARMVSWRHDLAFSSGPIQHVRGPGRLGRGVGNEVPQRGLGAEPWCG